MRADQVGAGSTRGANQKARSTRSIFRRPSGRPGCERSCKVFDAGMPPNGSHFTTDRAMRCQEKKNPVIRDDHRMNGIDRGFKILGECRPQARIHTATLASEAAAVHLQHADGFRDDKSRAEHPSARFPSRSHHARSKRGRPCPNGDLQPRGAIAARLDVGWCCPAIRIWPCGESSPVGVWPSGWTLHCYAVHGVASNQSDRVPHVPEFAYHGRRNSHNRRWSHRDVLEVGVIGPLAMQPVDEVQQSSND